jgi:hypothetical protein
MGIVASVSSTFSFPLESGMLPESSAPLEGSNNSQVAILEWSGVGSYLVSSSWRLLAPWRSLPRQCRNSIQIFYETNLLILRPIEPARDFIISRLRWLQLAMPHWQAGLQDGRTSQGRSLSSAQSTSLGITLSPDLGYRIDSSYVQCRNDHNSHCRWDRRQNRARRWGYIWDFGWHIVIARCRVLFCYSYSCSPQPLLRYYQRYNDFK